EVDAGARRRGRRGAEEAHPERDRSDGDEEREDLAKERVERVAGGVRDAEEIDGRHQLAAVADVDRSAGAGRVNVEEGGAESARRGSVAARHRWGGACWMRRRFSWKRALSGSIRSPIFSASTAAFLSPIR